MSAKQLYMELLDVNATLDDFEYWIALEFVQSIFYEEG